MKSLNLTPFPILITDRLILKQLELSDNAAIFKLRSDDTINAFINRKSAESIVEAQDFIKNININIANNSSIYWAIKLKNTNELIGTICFWNIEIKESSSEIGYELLPDYQAKGFMQEAIKEVINYGFKIGFKTINAYPMTLNFASINLLKRNNFQLIGELKDTDELIFTLTQQMLKK